MSWIKNFSAIQALDLKVYFERGSPKGYRFAYARGLRPQAQVSLLVIGFSIPGNYQLGDRAEELTLIS